MSTKNLIKKENKFSKEYFAKVVSNDDPLGRGRLQVKVETLMGDIPFWTNCTNQIGKVNFQLIPEPEDTVTVKFKNKDIYSGEWELKGSPINGTDEKKIDPKKYGFYDDNGNCIIINRETNDISITSINDSNVTVGNNCTIIVKGNANINVQGNATSTVAGTTEHICATNIIHGALHVDGPITTDSTVTASEEVTANTVTLTGHVHSYSWTDGKGSGDTDTGQG